jgi:hypothetical protein
VLQQRHMCYLRCIVCISNAHYAMMLLAAVTTDVAVLRTSSIASIPADISLIVQLT